MKRDEDQALGQVESSSRIFERPADGFMGAEYQHYLIPSDNTYKPHPEELSGLVNALVDGGYVLRTGTDTFNRAVINTFGDPLRSQIHEFPEHVRRARSRSAHKNSSLESVTVARARRSIVREGPHTCSL
jgi:hypothetical protein